MEEIHVKKKPRKKSSYNQSAQIQYLANDDFEYYTDRIIDINRYLANKDDVEDRKTHLSLKDDLVENIWQKFGENRN